MFVKEGETLTIISSPKKALNYLTTKYSIPPKIFKIFSLKGDNNQVGFARISALLTCKQTTIEIKSFLNDFKVNEEDKEKLDSVKAALRYIQNLKGLYLYSYDSSKFKDSKNEILSDLLKFFEKFLINSDDLSAYIWIIMTLNVLKNEDLDDGAAAIKIGVNICYVISHIVTILKISTIELLDELLAFLKGKILTNINIPYIRMMYLGFAV